MCMDRYYFGKYCMAIEFLVLIFYINSVSTTTKDFKTSNTNTTNVFRNNKTALYNTTISEASSSHKIFGISKEQENDFDLSEIIVHLDAALQERLIQNLDKEDTEFLRWLDIDPEPSESLARLKGFRRQTSKSLGLQEKKILEHLSFNKNLLSHSISNKKLKQGKESAQVRSQARLEKIIPELRSMYDSSSLDPSLKRPKSGSNGSLKRLKRQADLEPPRWPGMPTEVPGVLRAGHTNRSFVKTKIMNMMMQSLYSAQERLWPLAPIVAKYDHLTPYRMAFIFLKLDQLVHESHSIKMYIDRFPDMDITKRLQLYSQVMRRSIDVTYLVDYITERVPRDQMVRMRQQLIRHEQEKILEAHVAHLKTVTPRQRPTNY
ncbi:uncharacterized protein LOC134797222 [Cydia splendana]|uniref:uncharacterized protein LOC134797222 n=1 Tax=Cydia splendana TaxID=1100963 RepID=UPI0028F4A2A3